MKISMRNSQPCWSSCVISSRPVKLGEIDKIMNTLYTLSLLILITSTLLVGGCNNSKSSNDTPQPEPTDEVAAKEAEIRAVLNDVATDTDFSLVIVGNNGRQFSHSVGNSSISTKYRSASTSKWVTASVVLHLVDTGVLNLNDNPQDYIAFWPTTGNLSQIQLRHLLSFTSGLNNEPLCVNGPLQNFSNCVGNIVNLNTGAPAPGNEFHYGSAHMQVAGLMAVNASALNSWEQVFDNFKTDTGLFSNSAYDLPSAQNPRLAGGMHWIATDYVAFLQTLYDQSLLSPELIEMMTSDQFNGAVISSTPARAVGEDWHYGFGSWIECHSPTFNCGATTKVSSPGAYGAYPFIDYEHRYYGILAREGNLGTFAQGYAVFTAVESLLQEWATLVAD